MSDEIVLYGVGDVMPDREDPGSIFDHVRDVVSAGDIAFCQLERILSNRGSLVPQAKVALRGSPLLARAIKEAGFGVVSFASNHCMDLGRDALLDTIDALREQRLSVIGVGANISEARRPAVVECKGTRIAFLAYNSILPQGYWAEVDRPGCAPLRVFTVYEPIEVEQPGTRCRIHTYPRRDDLQAMVNDIRQAKSQANLVVVSAHWGIHLEPAVLAGYQREVARAVIDAGADLILGHHAHILKGVEVYKGKVIFYSLCNFAVETRFSQKELDSPGLKVLEDLYPNRKYDPEFPTYFAPVDSRKTMIAKCVISDKQIKSVSFLPTYINKRAEPEVPVSNDQRFGEVVHYMQKITADQGLATKYRVQGEEVMIGE